MTESYLKNPLLCRCGKLMIYSYSYNPFEEGTINDSDTEKNALVNFDDYLLSGEDFLRPRDTYIRVKCSECRYEKNVPDWVLGEFSGKT